MYKYNPYTDDHKPSEQIVNILDAIESMRVAIAEGGRLDGKRACKDKRFTIKEHQAGGNDEFAAYTIYDIAGIHFKVYRDSCKPHGDMEIPQFELAYDLAHDCGDVKFERYGMKRGYRALFIVGSYLIERDPSVTTQEVLEDVFGWEPMADEYERKAA